MSTTDVHRLIDNKLPKGKTCTAVSMYQVYTAKIDGHDVTVSVEPGLSEDDIAVKLVAETGTTKNAAMEGEEAPDEAEELSKDEFEYDDTEDDSDEFEDKSAPTTKKGKSKKK